MSDLRPNVPHSISAGGSSSEVWGPPQTSLEELTALPLYSWWGGGSPQEPHPHWPHCSHAFFLSRRWHVCDSVTERVMCIVFKYLFFITWFITCWGCYLRAGIVLLGITTVSLSVCPDYGHITCSVHVVLQRIDSNYYTTPPCCAIYCRFSCCMCFCVILVLYFVSSNF